MERTKYLLALLIVVVLSADLTFSHAQPSRSEQIYESYIAGDMETWKNLIYEMEKDLNPGSMPEQMELLNYYYGYIGYLVGEGEKTSAKRELSKAEKLLDAILDTNPSEATAIAYKGAFTAYRMYISKLSTPILGPQSLRYILKAYETDSMNVYALSNMGNMRFHAPAFFGGNKKEGIEYLNRAIGQLESTGQTGGNWNYLNLLVTYAQYLEKTGNCHTALEVYQKVLDTEAEFVWVRDELYPELRSKESQLAEESPSNKTNLVTPSPEPDPSR